MSQPDPHFDRRNKNPNADSRLPSTMDDTFQKPAVANVELSTELDQRMYDSSTHVRSPSLGTEAENGDDDNSETTGECGLSRPLVSSARDNYLDPSKHDLTGDRYDTDEDLLKSKKRELFCFHCNRLETHAPAARYGWIYSFLVGLTIGLIKLIGPFYCRCCGHRRYLNSDRLHPKFILLQRQLNQKRRRSR